MDGRNGVPPYTTAVLVRHVVNLNQLRVDIFLLQELYEIAIVALLAVVLEFFHEILDLLVVKSAFEEIQFFMVVINAVVMHGCTPLGFRSHASCFRNSGTQILPPET